MTHAITTAWLPPCPHPGRDSAEHTSIDAAQTAAGLPRAPRSRYHRRRAGHL